MPEKQRVLTPSGVRRIEEELRQLQTVRRREVAEQIRQTQGYGDTTESPDYLSAREEQAQLEARISALKNVLFSAKVLEDDEVPTDVVGIGSVVTVEDLDAGEEWELTLVSSAEADPVADRISNESPIGEALLDCKVGDTITVPVPEGEARYRVLSIRRPD